VLLRVAVFVPAITLERERAAGDQTTDFIRPTLGTWWKRVTVLEVRDDLLDVTTVETLVFVDRHQKILSACMSLSSFALIVSSVTSSPFFVF
jgi:hypothetical protein